MIAGEMGKKGIIRRSREVSTAVAVRYSDVREVLRAAFCDPVNERRIVANAYNSFEQKSTDGALSDWTRDDASKSMDVLNAFETMRNQFVGFHFSAPPAGQSYLEIGGVSVSVSCDILIQGEVRGEPYRGAALFRLAKPEEEETESAKAKRLDVGAYAATLVHMQASRREGMPPVHPSLCWSIDVQAGEVHPAPRNYRTRSGNMETACEFIAAMWDRV